VRTSVKFRRLVQLGKAGHGSAVEDDHAGGTCRQPHVSVLLAKGADVSLREEREDDGSIALAVATRIHRDRVATLLRAAGAKE
jgi:hypothetical protein